MLGYVSFHPVDPRFFDTIVEPLVAGEKVNPESFLDTAARVRVSAWVSLSYKLALEKQLELLRPPPPPTEGHHLGIAACCSPPGGPPVGAHQAFESVLDLLRRHRSVIAL